MPEPPPVTANTLPSMISNIWPESTRWGCALLSGLVAQRQAMQVRSCWYIWPFCSGSTIVNMLPVTVYGEVNAGRLQRPLGKISPEAAGKGVLSSIPHCQNRGSRWHNGCTTNVDPLNEGKLELSTLELGCSWCKLEMAFPLLLSEWRRRPPTNTKSHLLLPLQEHKGSDTSIGRWYLHILCPTTSRTPEGLRRSLNCIG